MTDTLRCAIVGTGAIAHMHARAVQAHPRAELVAVTDHVAAKADAFAAPVGRPRRLRHLDELLAGGASRRRPHLHAARRAPRPDPRRVRRGRARRRREAAGAVARRARRHARGRARRGQAARRRLPAAHRHRGGACPPPAAGRARSAARSSRVCQTLWYRDAAYFAVPWRGKWETEGGGTTLGHGIHQLDLLAFLLGDWARVEGRLWRLDRETQTEDASTATIVFDERRGRAGRHERGVAARDELDPHRHPEGDDHRRPSVRPRPRELGDHARAARVRGRGRAWALPERRGAQRPRARCCATSSTRCWRARRCRRRPTRRRDRSSSSRRSTPRRPPTAPSSRPQDLAHAPHASRGFASPVIDKRDLSRLSRSGTRADRRASVIESCHLTPVSPL